MKIIEKFIALKDSCRIVYESSLLTRDNKIRILEEMKARLGDFQCCKFGMASCPFSSLYTEEYDERYNETKTDFLCSYRNGFATSIDGGSITRNVFGTDCLINELETYIEELLEELIDKKQSKEKTRNKTHKR